MVVDADGNLLTPRTGTAEKPPLGPLRKVDHRVIATIHDAKVLKTQAEEKIREIIDEFEQATGCLVCDVGFWHCRGRAGVQRVELRVELR